VTKNKNLRNEQIITINLVTYCQKHRSFHSFMVYHTLLNCEGCLIRPSEAQPHPHLTSSWRQPWWSYSFRL